MDVYSCPKGHQSTEADFCSECGAKIAGSGQAITPRPTAAVGPVCPDCGGPRPAADVVFCEVCGYNFSTGVHGEIPLPAPPPPPAPTPDAAPEIVTSPPTSPVSWSVVVSIDPALHEPGSPDPPSGIDPFPVRLEKTVSLIGRRSLNRAIDPEIPLDFDEAVSHRHALLNLCEDGALVLRDIGSSNGTLLNGAPVPPLVDQPLQDGDQMTLGHWTRISVKAQ